MKYHEPTLQMRELFLVRTRKHIQMVDHHLNLCEGILGLTKNELSLRGIAHDQSKFGPEEETAYIWLNWLYHKKVEIKDYQLPEDVMVKVMDTLKTHSLKNSHHPEFYEDCNQMKAIDLVEMVCDWMAIAEENMGPGSSCRSWAEANLEKKWSFSFQMKSLVFEIISKIEERKLRYL